MRGFVLCGIAGLMGAVLTASAFAQGLAGSGETQKVIASDLVGRVAEGQRLSREKGCIGCHGVDGISTNLEFPHLAGQPAPYTLRQLEYFRAPRGEGRAELGRAGAVARRWHPLMREQVADLTEQDIVDLAAYYESLECAAAEGPQIAAPALAQRCVSCHGQFGVAATPNTPHLASQSRRYVIRQLIVYKHTPRNASEGHPEIQRFHPIMNSEARRLSDRDIAEISRYYAGLSCRGKR